MSPPEHDFDDPAFDCNGEVDSFLSKMTLEEQKAFMERAFSHDSAIDDTGNEERKKRGGASEVETDG